MSYLDITAELTKEGIKKLKVGQILMFKQGDDSVYLKIMRNDKTGVKAKRLDPAKFLTPEEADNEVEVVAKYK